MYLIALIQSFFVIRSCTSAPLKLLVALFIPLSFCAHLVYLTWVIPSIRSYAFPPLRLMSLSQNLVNCLRVSLSLYSSSSHAGFVPLFRVNLSFHSCSLAPLRLRFPLSKFKELSRNFLFLSIPSFLPWLCMYLSLRMILRHSDLVSPYPLVAFTPAFYVFES